MTKDKRRRKQQKKKVETLNRNLKFPKRDSSKSKTGNENSTEGVRKFARVWSNTTEIFECDDDEERKRANKAARRRGESE